MGEVVWIQTRAVHTTALPKTRTLHCSSCPRDIFAMSFMLKLFPFGL